MLKYIIFIGSYGQLCWWLWTSFCTCCPYM